MSQSDGEGKRMPTTGESASGGSSSSSPSQMRTARPSSQRPPRARQPPSMWTAPQSFIPPPSPTHYVEPRRAETFFRRVTHPSNPNGPPPSRSQRIANLSGGLLAGVLIIYSVLWADFGDQEHVFSPIRRALGTQNHRGNPFGLSTEEKAQAQAQRASLNRQPATPKLV